MTVITTTLYYENAQTKNDTHNDDDFYGRALTKDEYENITADELEGCHQPFHFYGGNWYR